MNSAVDDVVVVMNDTKKNACASERSAYDWSKTRGKEKLQVRTKHNFFFFIKRLMIEYKKINIKKYTATIHVVYSV